VGTALTVIVVLLVIAWAATTQLRQAQNRAKADEDLATRAATGDPEAVQALARRLTLGRVGDCLRAAAAARRHLTNRLAPAAAAGLARGEPPVAEACTAMLEEVGAPGMRAAWSLYTAQGTSEPARSRLRAFLLRNPDWLAHELFELWAHAGGQGEPPHADLWRDGGLQQRLRALMAMGDPHVVPLAERLLRRLGTEAPEVEAPEVAPASR
jgi:hypothetical protein